MQASAHMPVNHTSVCVGSIGAIWQADARDMLLNYHSWKKLTKTFVSTCGNSRSSCTDAQNDIVRLQVPPMTPEKTKEVIEQRLGKPIDAVFAWIDLAAPLGSASIAQVIRKLQIVIQTQDPRCLLWLGL